MHAYLCTLLFAFIQAQLGQTLSAHNGEFRSGLRKVSCWCRACFDASRIHLALTRAVLCEFLRHLASYAATW